MRRAYLLTFCTPTDCFGPFPCVQRGAPRESAIPPVVTSWSHFHFKYFHRVIYALEMLGRYLLAMTDWVLTGRKPIKVDWLRA